MSDYLSITAVHALLPDGTAIREVWRARSFNAMPDPDIQLSIVTPGQSKPVPAWHPDRILPWVDRVADTTRGEPLRQRHLKFLAADRTPEWTFPTRMLATAADIRAVCPSATKEQIRYRLRRPGWWQGAAVQVANRTGWTLNNTRCLIDDVGLDLDLGRWARLTALADPTTPWIDREAHLAALAAD